MLVSAEFGEIVADNPEILIKYKRSARVNPQTGASQAGEFLFILLHMKTPLKARVFGSQDTLQLTSFNFTWSLLSLQ